MLSYFNLSFLFSQWWKFSFQTFIFCCCFWRDIYIHRFSSLSSLAYKILLCLLYKDFSLFSHFYIIVFIWALVLLIFIAFKLIFIKHFQFSRTPNLFSISPFTQHQVTEQECSYIRNFKPSLFIMLKLISIYILLKMMINFQTRKFVAYTWFIFRSLDIYNITFSFIIVIVYTPNFYDFVIQKAF